MDQAQIKQALARAVACYEAGDMAGAEKIYRVLVVEAPDVAKWSDLGVVLKSQDRFEEAAAAYARAIELSPGEPTPHFNLANLRRDSAQWDEAIEGYRRALALKPDFIDARINLGRLLLDRKRPAEALEQLARAVEIAPDAYNAHNNLGIALRNLGRIEDAAASHRRATELRPDSVESQSNLGSALLALGRVDEAIWHCRRAVQIDASYANGHYNLAACFLEAPRLDEAKACYARAIALEPGNEKFRWNHSLALLVTGDLPRGWLEYEWRMVEGITPRRYGFIQWIGQRAPGKRLLLWGEQGLGDEILYAGMVPDLLGAGLEITLEVDPRLVTIMQRSFPSVRVVASAAPPALNPADYDWQSPLASLGQWLRPTFESFPRHGGYLKPDAARVQALAARLRGDGASPVVGVSWRSTNPDIGESKSTAIADWADILKTPGVRFVDLQYGDTSEERETLKRAGIGLTHLDDIDLYNDIEGLAALISACDLVITSSNVTAHVAGALGKPVWLLCPIGRGYIWYWFDGRTDSPWYPSMRIFRQPKPGDWKSAISEVAAALASRVGPILRPLPS